MFTIRVALQQQKITYRQLVIDSLRCIAQHQKLNMVLNIRSQAAFLWADKLDQQKSPLTKNILYGIPFAVKDNFNIRNEVTTAGCAFLKKYYPNDHATVIKLLQKQQANLIAKTNMDALGMGGSGLTSDYGLVHNPYDPQRIAGGSSSGSAVLVAVGAVVYALGSDTGDSIRKPASYCGVVGLKPTYGLISRAGVIGFSPSLDTIGILTRSVTDCAEVLNVLAQHDPHDFTSIFLNQQINYGLLARKKNQARKLKVLYFENMFVTLRSEIRTLYQKLWYFFKEQHVHLDKQTFPAQLLNILPVVYKIISCSEATTTHANLDGVNFERRVNNVNFKKSSQQARAHFLNYELKKRFVFGSYCLLPENQENILHQAQKIRRLLHNFFTHL